MAGRQQGLLGTVEQEDEVVGQGDTLAVQKFRLLLVRPRPGHDHSDDLEHDGTADGVVTRTWTLDMTVNGPVPGFPDLGHAVEVAVEEQGRSGRQGQVRGWRDTGYHVTYVCVRLQGRTFSCLVCNAV